MSITRVLAFTLLLLNVLALYDILRRPVDLGSKLMWIALVWLFPFVGLLLYLLFGRPNLIRAERTGQSQF
ncbi:MAG TPA: PLD nuclease N-terminal domain-containing protein [Armatimonadota bacterium]|jgi:hypothetical protein|nr:PLDc_N domain-containing protein [Armatimonadota bacterium]HOJ23016.1 PLD nuclease N-terminal domain-containing protein [Armatimonadota bacterium]HOM82766.1 PLD nuclease N-terminal domain-containing protein [Armatimonadota bacterium]HOQ29850.1 PLD nuclease N-terminal domain-containing protein [Armatimonadota bacterium]HPO73555.1 PLD nuclease N-terminal domain-containing protein [Armatimonadota bacterium]